MKLTGIQLLKNNNNMNFGSSTRVLKNAVTQLSKNNKYSLNEPNQRRIRDSIEQLSKIPQKNIADFLLKTAQKLKYSTNIKLENQPINDWKSMLITAAMSVLSLIPFVDKTKFSEKIDRLNSSNELNKIEKDILNLRDKLLEKVDLEQIEKETVGGIKDFKGNLDYFIISSETTQEHKKYVLKQLNYLMSNRYKINPQLKDKKSIVAAELINDMAIFTPGHKVPNIKAVNQKQHGMCAAISIVRKKIAYEDKPDYIDSILSELDDSEYIKVYDRTKLGSGEKTYLSKVPVDFEAALAKGYRIIDASATQWMEIANSSGYSKNSLNSYTSFDKTNFDINADSFYNVGFNEPELNDLHEYYQALIKAKNVIDEYRANSIKNDVVKNNKHSEFKKNSNAIQNVLKNLYDIITVISPKNNTEETRGLVQSIINLRKTYSYEINSQNKFEYIDNEEESVKKDKIRRFLEAQGLNKDNINSNIDKIFDNVEFFHQLNDSIKVKSSSRKGLSKAINLYEVGAGIRYQFLKSLQNEDMLRYMMHREHIANREECIQNIIDALIKQLKENGSNTQAILNSLSQNTEENIQSADRGIEILDGINKELTRNSNKMDKIYKAIGLNNKIDGLVEHIENLLLEITENKNSKLISSLADDLNIKASAKTVSAKLEELKNSLIKNKNNYNKVFNLIGNSSQISFLNDILQKFIKDLSEDETQQTLDTFIMINNLDINNLSKEVNSKANELLKKVSDIYYSNEILTRLLRIYDDKGNLIYSPDSAEILIKTFENTNAIPSSEALKELQEHLDKIQKDRSSDEFNSRQGKLKNKKLYKFTESEHKTLNNIEKNINPISRYIKKQLTHLQQYIMMPLEELKRVIGINMGHWWVGEEGSSGLYTGQDIRVLEYITGRYHYSTNNIKNALDRIKSSPYSGISSSSVYHDRPGFHAQYIADIEPVKLKTRDENGNVKEEQAEVLFQDNSWGASEHENTWVDSTGLTRTDYSDNRGGTLGYITNGKYRNGNLVSRVLEDMVLESEPENIESRIYKRLRKSDENSFKLPQYTSIILDGKSPNLDSIALSIYDTIFKPTANLINTIKKLTKNMSSEELNEKLHSIITFKNNWEGISDKVLNEIRSEYGKYNIQTEEEYNKLPDTDFIKIILEKAALQKNYYIENIPPEIDNVQELEKYKRIQKRRAVKNFQYSFGKNIDILKYVADSLSAKDAELIDAVLKKYNINYTDKEFDNIFCCFEIADEDFDGSVKHSIDNIIKNILGKIKENLYYPDAENEIQQVLKEIFTDKMYFKINNLNNPDIKHIIRFIDRFYNPGSDEELVKIYNKLQDLTTEEFKTQILPNLNNDDLNIKNETGFGLLKKIQRYKENAENEICNLIYADEIAKNTEKSKYSTEYTNNKLTRTPKVLAKYTFDSSYIEMKNDLSLLILPKRFDKYKERNLNKYGAFPAYPKVDYMSEDMFEKITEALIDSIADEIEQIKNTLNYKEYYQLTDSLKSFSKQFKDTDILTEEQYDTLNIILGKICTLIYNDETQSEVNEAALNAMEIERGEEFKIYNKFINTIINDVEILKNNVPEYMIDNQITSDKTLLSKQSDMLVKTYIRTRYQKNFFKTLNDYKKSIIRNEKDVNGNLLSEAYRVKLIDELKAFNILQEPDELLERFVQSLANDSPLHDYSNPIESLLKRALDYAKLSDIQRTIMDALNDGIETDVKSVFKKIKVQRTDGLTDLMSDDYVISYMINSLVYDNQYETALFFIDKLGVNETYVTSQAEDFDYDETKKMIEDTVTKLEHYQKYSSVFTKNYGATIEEIKNNKNPIKLINRLQRTLVEASKTYSIDKKYSKIFISAINDCKKAWKENPGLSKADIMTEIFYSAGKNFETQVNEIFDESFAILKSQQSIIEIMNNVSLNKGSNAAKIREEVNDKFIELVEYNNQLMSDLHTEE